MSDPRFSRTDPGFAFPFPVVGILILPSASGLLIYDTTGFLAATKEGSALGEILAREAAAPGAARRWLDGMAPPAMPTADAATRERIHARLAAMRNPADARPDGEDIENARNIKTEGLD